MKTFAIGISLAALSFAGLAYSANAMPGGRDGDRTVTRSDALARSGQMFDRMDINKDGTLNAADREARRAAAFDRLDADKNGQITRAEFTAERPRMGRRGMGAEGDGDWQGKGGGRMGGRHHGGRGMGGGRLMRMADTNRDGAVTKAEMTAAAATRFDTSDSNRDGTLTPEERRAAMSAMRERMRGMSPPGGADAPNPVND